MEPSRLDIPQSFVTCSRVFSEPDVASVVTGLQSEASAHCLSERTRASANQGSRSLAAKFSALPLQSSGAPRASSVTGTSHQ